MNVENIPTYLKAHASWCNFRYEERKGNMTKVPYNPATGYKVYVNKSETFTDFETAVSALKDYDDLGIRVDSIIIAIDLVSATANEDFNDEIERLVTHHPEDSTKYPWTDIGAGMLFADFYKPILRYVPERKAWFYYADGTWQPDVGGLKAMRLCMELANLLHMYALKITDEHKRKEYMNYTRRWQTHGTIVNILKDAQVYHTISATVFDADPYIFNCKNGTIDMNTLECREHKSSDKLTKISNVIYDPHAHNDC